MVRWKASIFDIDDDRKKVLFLKELNPFLVHAEAILL